MKKFFQGVWLNKNCLEKSILVNFLDFFAFLKQKISTVSQNPFAFVWYVVKKYQAIKFQLLLAKFVKTWGFYGSPRDNHPRD